jgi:GIY-YIG catalytic domain
MNHGIYVPIQKCSKFNKFLKNKIYIYRRTYTTLSGNPLDNDYTNYIKVYENAFDMRKDILKENKGKSGIYMLTNKLTNDIYIGQSADISKRFKNYFNLSYIKSKNSFIINRALIKYGYSNFSVTIIEYCDKSDLLVRELYYFDKLKPQYNIRIAGSSQNFKRSEDIKTEISKSLKEVYTKECGNPVNIYEKCSSEGYKLIGCFVSARRAGKFLGISGSTVIKYMNSGKVFKDKYKFSSK